MIATKDVIAAVGLDRHLRLFESKTHNLLQCIYLKQRLTCVDMVVNEQELAELELLKKQELINEKQEDDDELWNELSKISKRQKI